MASIGRGSTLEVMSGSTFSVIGKLKTVNLPEMTRTEIETTTLDSTDKEFMPGMRNNGTVNLTQEWTQAHYASWVGLDNDDLHTFRITPVGGSDYTFDAYVAKLGLPIEMDGELMINVDLKVSGEVTS